MARCSHWLPAAAWAALIFAFSSIPAVNLPPAPQFVSFLAHFFEFFVLSVLLMWGLTGRLRSRAGAPAYALVFVASAAYGLSDELHQLFVPGRVADVADVAFDALGAAAGVAAVLALQALLRLRGRSGGAGAEARRGRL